MSLKDWEVDKLYVFMAFLAVIVAILGISATEIIKEFNKPKQVEAK